MISNDWTSVDKITNTPTVQLSTQKNPIVKSEVRGYIHNNDNNNKKNKNKNKMLFTCTRIVRNGSIQN